MKKTAEKLPPTSTVLTVFLSVVCLSLYSSYVAEEDNSPGVLNKYFSGGVNIRFRNESWNTFEKQGQETDRIERNLGGEIDLTLKFTPVQLHNFCLGVFPFLRLRRYRSGFQ